MPFTVSGLSNDSPSLSPSSSTNLLQGSKKKTARVTFNHAVNEYYSKEALEMGNIYGLRVYRTTRPESCLREYANPIGIRLPQTHLVGEETHLHYAELEEVEENPIASSSESVVAPSVPSQLQRTRYASSSASVNSGVFL